MGDPWGIGGFRREEKPNIKQIVKKIGEKSEKAAKSEKNRGKRALRPCFFFCFFLLFCKNMFLGV